MAKPAQVVLVAALALLLFVAGTILLIYNDLQVAQVEFDADWLDAILKEAEH